MNTSLLPMAPRYEAGMNLELELNSDLTFVNREAHRGLSPMPLIQKLANTPLAIWQQAAAAGLPGACWLLGCCYLNGHGVEANPEEAIRLFRLSAEQGDLRGQMHLGWCYHHGVGAEEDPDEGLRWIR